MRALLYRPPEKHHAHRWGVYVQLPNNKRWLLHYDNVIRGDGLRAEEFREMMNIVLKGGIVAVEAEWMVKVLKVYGFERREVKK
ncbi:MAG: hypothetical protein QXL54_05095 [Candidatus Bathyarchaeia archaeon]